MNSSVFLICGCHALGGREGVWDWRSTGQPNWKINFPGDSSWLLPGCLSQISSILISQIRGRQRGKKILRFEMDCLPLNIFVISSEFSATQDRGQCMFFQHSASSSQSSCVLRSAQHSLGRSGVSDKSLTCSPTPSACLCVFPDMAYPPKTGFLWNMGRSPGYPIQKMAPSSGVWKQSYRTQAASARQWLRVTKEVQQSGNQVTAGMT